jgi:predicted nuclease of restriction endonuclease-like (RecB) superfamily
MNTLQNNQLDKLVGDVRTLLSQARQATARAINTAMVTTYWMIGQRIVVEEQKGADRAAYGQQILQRLSAALEKEFGNGFSYANLRNMRQFYLTYPEEEICYTLCSKLSWSHNRLIMRVQDSNARHYYLTEAAQEGWSVRALERNIESHYYQRMLAAPGGEEYSVLNGSQQLFAAKYLPYMPTEEELRNMIENNVRLIESGKVEGK